MTNYPRSDYGTYNPNSGKPANGDFAAWGGYQWPNCAPSSLLSTTDYTSKFGQRMRVVLRSGIIELATLMFQIADKHGYVLYSNHNGENWGPWGMECRAISGTNSPSGHSGGLAMDWNAPFNTFSLTFQSDMPPAMVADIEACGWFWGGRYSGQKYDAMHFSYCYTPSDVPRFVAKAKSILGGTPPTPPKDDSMSAAEVAQITAKIDNLVNLLFQPDMRGGGHTIREEESYATEKRILPRLEEIKTDADDQRQAIAEKVIDVHERVLNPGGLWDNFQDIVLRLNLILEALKVPVPTGPVPAPAAPTTYTVVSGDTLSGIAAKTGHTIADLQTWNKITDPNSINVGQVLRLGP